MQKSEYVKIALNNKEVQQVFVDAGIIDLGVIYNKLMTIAEKENISYEVMSTEEIVTLLREHIK